MTARILIVDDEEPILHAVGEYLRAKGYEVDCALELEEAEALLSHHEYALVLTDLRLTAAYGGEGLSLAAFARERCRSTRTLILTGNGSREARAEARRIGVDGFIQKSVPLGDVARAIQSLLEGRA